MEPFKTFASIGVPIEIANCDTDQIIPARFLTTTVKEGLGDHLFTDWRYDANGNTVDEFVLNQTQAEDAAILVAGRNFGCGSSREHAPWALLDYGFKVIIAPSFADIFRNNCFQNGMLSIILEKKEVDYIMGMSLSNKGYQLNVDLENEVIYDDKDFKANFKIDPFRKESLLKGQDEIARTLDSSSHIDNYEKNRIERW